MHPVLRRVLVVAGALALVLLIYLLDTEYSAVIRLSVLYLVPVLVATWFEGPIWGALCVVATVVLRMTVETSQAGVGIEGALLRQIPFVIVSAIAMFGFRHMRRTQDELHRLATHDHLTNVLNVGAFNERVTHELLRNRRYGRSGALLYLDLDNFKSMNDTYGHQTGDGVLRLVADALQRAVRQVDVVGRMGGDEFAVLMPETDDLVAAAAARRLNETLRAAFDGTPAVTASIGVVSFGATPVTADDVLRRADQAMYEAKRMGKDRVVHVRL